jgi:hypothetical protein
MDAEQIAYARRHNLRWQDQFDYPMSWTFWRAATWDNTGFDIGPCEPPQHTVDELHERLAVLEESTQSEKPKLEIGHHHEKPKPRLSGGVKL